MKDDRMRTWTDKPDQKDEGFDLYELLLYAEDEGYKEGKKVALAEVVKLVENVMQGERMYYVNREGGSLIPIFNSIEAELLAKIKEMSK